MIPNKSKNFSATIYDLTNRQPFEDVIFNPFTVYVKLTLRGAVW